METNPTPFPAVQPLALRAKDAAKALGISPRTLWAWTAAGYIPHFRRGAVVLFPVAGLAAWLAENSTGGTGGGK